MSQSRSTDDTLRLVLVVLAVLVLAPVLTMVLAVPMMGLWGGGMMGGGTMGSYGMYGGTGVSPLWGIGMGLLWLVVLVALGYLAYRWFAGRSGIGTDPAMEELRVAYARGDVTDEEFEERRSKLEAE